MGPDREEAAESGTVLETVQAVPEQLSGVAVVIIIAVGVQTFIMLFIFAKRQIMRFTLRSRRGPHVSVGQGGLKPLRREIDRRLEYANHIRCEPRLCRPGISETVAHHPRMLALDRLQELDDVIARYGTEYVRSAGSNVRSFLIECLAGPLVGLDPKQVHLFCDGFDHARHSYKPFGSVELNNYLNLLNELKSLVVRNTQNKPAMPKKSTPVHSKAVNRPRRRIHCEAAGRQAEAGCGTGSTTVVTRNSSTVLLAAHHNNAMENSTQV